MSFNWKMDLIVVHIFTYMMEHSAIKINAQNLDLSMWIACRNVTG